MSTPPRESAIFDDARKISSRSERNAYVQDACCDDVTRRCRVEQLLAEYREAIAINPNYEFGHLNLGAALHKQGKLDGD